MEIVNKRELPLEDFNNLFKEELDALQSQPNHFAPRRFISLGDMVYIRPDITNTISYLEGIKHEVRDSQTHALAEIVYEGNSYVYGMPLSPPVTSDAIRSFIYDNDIQFWLSKVGARIVSYRIETRLPYIFDDSNSAPGHLPHYLQELIKTEAFTNELVPTEPTPLDVPNSMRLTFAREDLYEDKLSKHTWVNSSYGISIPNTGWASLRNSAKYNLIEAHMLLFMESSMTPLSPTRSTVDLLEAVMPAPGVPVTSSLATEYRTAKT